MKSVPIAISYERAIEKYGSEFRVTKAHSRACVRVCVEQKKVVSRDDFNI